jgi:hypothetical protein
LAGGGSMKGKVSTSVELQRLHAQDDAGQRGTQDFRIGERRPGVEIGLVVQADADAGRHPAATAGALVGRRLRDLLDLQLLDLVAVGVALDARQPGVDDVADARHGERGFGNVGRQHDAPLAADEGLKMRSCSPAERRENSGRISGACAVPPACQRMLAQRLRRLADFALAGQEDEDVAGAEAGQFVGGIDDGVVEIALVVLLVDVLDRPMTHLDRVQRPETSITGAPLKCCEKRSASMVAEVMISFRSGRFGSNCFR